MLAGMYRLSGAVVVIENLAKALSEKGVDVSISSIRFTQIPKVEGIPYFEINSLSSLERLSRDFDIIHNHHPIMNYVASICKVPFLYHYHGAPDVDPINLYRLSMILSIGLTRRSLKGIVSVSHSGANELQRMFGIKKAHVIYNGVDTSVFKPNGRKTFGQGSPQMLFVGNLYKHKNVQELVFFMRAVLEQYPNAHLAIIGLGQAYGALEAETKRNDLHGHVSLLGHISAERLPDYFASCDVYVTASRYEVCPVPLLEAMACGKPIVASRILSHKELITTSKAGLLYRPGNARDFLNALRIVYEYKEDFERSALQFALANDWSKVADRVLALYENILDNRMNLIL